MSFQVMGIIKDFMINGGQTTGVDLNQDNNQEYTLNQTESGTSFEIFDFNSDGIKDMDMYYDKDGGVICTNFWDENGEIWQPENQELQTYLERAQELRENAEKEPMEEYKGLNDIQEEHLAILEAMRNLQNQGIENKEVERDISELEIEI